MTYRIYEEKKERNKEYFLQSKIDSSGEFQLNIVDSDGHHVTIVLRINNAGKLYLLNSVDPDAARDLELKLDCRGRIQICGESE